MKKQNKFKFYFYHSSYLNLSGKTRQEKAKMHKLIVPALFQITFEFFYRTGSWVIKISKGMGFALRDEILSTKRNVQSRIKILLQSNFAKTILVFLILSSISFLGFSSIQQIARGFNLKQLIINKASVGSQQLTEAKDALQQQNFQIAQSKFSMAYVNFAGAKEEINKTGGLFSAFIKILPIARQTQSLLDAAELISASGLKSIELYSNISKLKFTAQGLEAAGPTNEVLENIESNLSQIRQDIGLAEDKISTINNLPQSYAGQFSEIKSKVQVLQSTFENLNSLFALAKQTASGDKNILLLFENNNELRATGGFLGSYGSFNLKDGKILKTHISSIYDLDGQLAEKIMPPEPVLNVNDRWFLRDSNWFANFPDSAKKIISFYEKEGGETPDLIIALTPNLIIDLLKITGPISLPNYQTVLNQDNFVEKTQMVTSLSTDNPENTPKQILADLVPVLLQKISGFNSSQLQAFVEMLYKNIQEKQVVMYALDSNSQTILSNYKLTGEILNTNRDYLAIISSNLGGTKSDLYIDQSIDLKSAIDKDGNLINELTINRTNLLPKMEKTYNLSFLRIYVPLGSTLLSTTGFDFKNLKYEKPADFKTDPDVYNWEKTSLKDVVTGTVIGQEAGKTFFGNWLNVEGGETRTVKISYKLPFKLKDVDNYSLLAQKQIGTGNQKFTFNLSFSGRRIEWKNFETDSLNSSDLTFNTVLNKDIFLGAVLVK